MERNLLLRIIPFLVFIITHCSNKPPAQEEFSSYLPDQSALKGWRPLYEPQMVEGEDLYMLIDGGAEIYYEYGFKRAFTQSYEDRDGRSINLEIYEMNNPVSAHGAYTFKTGEKGERIAVGNEALLEDYYLNFWKGNCVVTLIGFDTDDKTREGLMTIAEAVDSRIKDVGQKSPLVDILIEENLEKTGVTYLRGNLGLFNRYEFDTENIFGLKEGVIGNYGDFQVFIFRYDDENESLRCFENARNRLKTNPRFTDFTARDDAFSIVDSREKHIIVEPYGRYILIVMSKKGSDARTTLDRVKDRIKNISEKR
jgi:hypothetical protein